MLSAIHIARSFGGVQALHDVSLFLEPGNVAVCAGPNGAGKTTLLNILSGWDQPDQGSVYLEGKPIARLTPEIAHRLRIVRTFSTPRIFRNLSVFDNIYLACAITHSERFISSLLRRRYNRELKEQVRLKTTSLLEELAIADKVDTVAGNLSGGQQKLLDFACALARNGKILLLDEPVSGRLPSQLRSCIGEMIRQFADAGNSVLVVEHNRDFIRSIADRILVLASRISRVAGETGGGFVLGEGRATEARTWQLLEESYNVRA